MPKDYYPLYMQLGERERALFDALVYDDTDIDELSQILYEQKLGAYTGMLIGLSQEFGEAGEIDPATVAWIRSQADEEAEDIAGTYAYDLAKFLLGMGSVPDIELEVRIWEKKRSEYKNPMIALHNILEWSAKAIVAYLIVRPMLPAYAELLPRVPVVCETCNYYVNMGKVPFASVRDVIQDWPPHPNCIHHWRITRA